MNEQERSLTATFVLIAELAAAKGVQRISQLPGLWCCDVDERWRVEVNGHDEDIDSVPPYHARITYNGWPAGLASPYEGVTAAGKYANKDSLKAHPRKAASQTTAL